MITEEQAGLYRVRDDDPFGADPLEDRPRPISDYKAAQAAALRKIAALLERDENSEDLGDWIILIGRMVRRRI